MSGPSVPLRAWWVLGVPLLAGLGVIGATGRLLLGGCLMTIGFVGALVIRVSSRSERTGGLSVRSRPADTLFYASAAVNVVGAVLLVTAHADWRILMAVDAVLALLVAAEWWRGFRAGARLA